ncbi:hypothetical protein ACFWAP_00590 [Streptomyces goshikiensis]|uniref:hypothetical protein n=1 Tax=Streptomyces goshikiensis TaxID=1942 RepID=UPI0036634DB2
MWPTSFAISDARATRADITTLAYAHPEWQLSEIKHLTVREREYWRDLAVWVKERKEAASRG